MVARGADLVATCLAGIACAGAATAVFALCRAFRRLRLSGKELPRLVTPVPGPRSRALIDRLAQHECPAITMRRARRADALGVADTDPIVWEAAKGTCVRDVDGNVFVDLTSGFGVATAGHSSDRVVAAAQRQAARPLLHAMGDAFADPRRIELLEELSSFFPGTGGAGGAPAMSRGILGCSGADAVQAALKTAALATGRPGVLAFSGGYHGLAHGALALTAYKADDFRRPFVAQLGAHATFAPFGALPLPPLRQVGIGAVIVEPLQGRGGVREAPAGWLHALRAHCDAEGALLIYDEVYTGFGRTGEWFAFLTARKSARGSLSVRPDVIAPACGTAAGSEDAPEAPYPDLICLGKAMGGGVPISACIGTRAAMSAWGASRGEALHTQTFLGNPLACACALAALRELKAMDAPTVARRKGEAFRGELARVGFAESAVRGRGLMLAVQVPSPLAAMTGLLSRGVIALPCGEGPDFALSLIPPLTITEPQMRYCAEAIAACCGVHPEPRVA